MKYVLFALAAFGPLAPSQGAHAATQTASMGVSADVATVCSISVGGDMAFGAVNVSGVTDATTTVSTTCTNGGAYSISLDDGTHAVAGQRTLSTGTATLNYDIYTDDVHTHRWGHTATVDTVDGTGTGSAVSVTAYGEMPSQALTTGSYTDTITATVTY